MVRYGVCLQCEAVVRTSNFDGHRRFHIELGVRDPGPHGFSEIEEPPMR